MIQIGATVASYRSLKLELLLYGVAVSDPRLSEKILALPEEELSIAGRRVDLTFPDGTRVSAPLTDGSPYRLSLLRPGVAQLQGRNVQVEAHSILTSDFHQRFTSQGTPFSEIGRICGGYFFLPLGQTPAAAAPADSCPVSGLPQMVFHDLRDVHEVLSAAFGEKLVQVVKIAVKLPAAFDKPAIEQVLPYIEMIKRNFKSYIYLSIPPPESAALLPLIYARGVDVVFCDLLLTDEKRAAMHLPFRRNFSTEEIIETLARLVSIFPRGAVLSRLLLGWEPIEETEQGAQRLLQMGVVPVLSLIPVDRDRLSDVVRSAIYDFLQSLHVDLDRNIYSRWIHSHLHMISDCFTPNDSLDIDQTENGASLLDRVFDRPWSRRALAYAWGIRRSLKVVEGGSAPDGRL
ncbi:hypothetical protein HY522_01020 [bacterium]|nr:hypothetical protein [bacterium]